ncbi:MAG: putative zinc-binding metallo-peptidase [Pseudomonadota bacterium]|jgi:hypothetical protein
MGLPDTYPFVLSKPVQDELRLIHGIVHERDAQQRVTLESGAARSSRARLVSSLAPALPGE